MQVSFTTIGQLMVALLAGTALAAPLSTTAAEEPKLQPRRDSRCADMGYGCERRCYPHTDVLARNAAVATAMAAYTGATADQCDMVPKPPRASQCFNSPGAVVEIVIEQALARP
ncbi:hypothetical protein PpBr36_02640 [Pyricularia pennisetigena]|uniref:hypothetical protein n=1 Tax=Pyricularia pennisetigena TaxID=1578925 RepID=UPI001154E1D5|nr:hypothetical protein PpBr36_02640 [Pyricularia pennisetigena]TLS30928.1 hypothetical protein PpBr36_02640 [Pyricularia pennisetigena]